MEEDSGEEEEEKDKDKAEWTREDDWTSTANVLRETHMRILDVPSGRKVGNQTWQWNEEVQGCMQKKKRFAQRKWDFHARLDSEDGENDIFRLTTERQGWKRCAGKKLS